MAFDLKEINFRTVADPKGFIEECDDVYASRVKDAAEKITFAPDREAFLKACKVR